MKTKPSDQVFEKVRDYMDNEVSELSRSDYRDFLERIQSQIQIYIECWEQEEKNTPEDA